MKELCKEDCPFDGERETSEGTSGLGTYHIALDLCLLKQLAHVTKYLLRRLRKLALHDKLYCCTKPGKYSLLNSTLSYENQQE